MWDSYVEENTERKAEVAGCPRAAQGSRRLGGGFEELLNALEVEAGFGNYLVDSGLSSEAAQNLLRVSRDHGDLGVWGPLFHSAGGFKAVDARHSEVEQDEVWIGILERAQRLFAGPCDAHDLELWIKGQHQENQFLKNRLVIHDHDFDAFHIRRVHCSPRECPRADYSQVSIWMRPGDAFSPPGDHVGRASVPAPTIPAIPDVTCGKNL